MSQTIIKVPGMFLADEYNTPLAKTSDIYDDTQDKYQEEINEHLYQTLTNKEDKSLRGIAGGIASLDETGKIPMLLLPENIAVEYVDDADVRALFYMPQ